MHRNIVSIAFKKMVVLSLLLVGNAAIAQNTVLLIASGYSKGQGPFTATIQTPLVTAGYSVQVWTQTSLGWPPLDTLQAYDAVFFHGSERTKTEQIDSTMTAFVEEGGRLVVEGTVVAQWTTVYWDFRKHVSHALWRKMGVASNTYQIIDTEHPITAGLPATLTTSGYYSASPPDFAEAWFGGRRLIAYQNTGNAAALVVSPRSVFFNGSLHRVNSAANRDSLIVRSVRYVLSDPEDAGVTNIDYELGHRANEDIPVLVTLQNWSASAAEGTLYIDESADSAAWDEVTSTPYLLTGFGENVFNLTWHPTAAQRYYVRARIVPNGSDEQPDNNEVGMRVTTLIEAQHPKLFFTADDVPDLQVRAATTHAGIASAIESFVNTNLNYTLLPPHQWYAMNYPRLSQVVTNTAIQAVLEPTETYLDAAKRVALGLSSYPHWETDNVDQDIYAARACYGLALAYDWLYHEFTPAQRDTVQIKLRTQLERLDAAGAQYLWWTESLIHNHNWNCWGYQGSASFALMEEEPDAALWEQRSIENLNQRMILYGDVTDGSWYEAMNYWGFITWTTLPHIYLLREQMGINYFDRPFFQNLAKYRIYGCLPDVDYMYVVNDGQPAEWYGPHEQLSLLAHEYQDGEAQWLHQRLVEAVGHETDGPLDLFWYDPTIPETPPAELSTFVEDQDTYFARSDWTTGATFFALKCGLPTGRHAYETFWANSGLGRFSFSHFTPDQNAFSLFYNGRYLSQSSGVQVPQQYTRHSSTVLINGHGQLGDSTKGSWILSSNYASYNPHIEDHYATPKLDYVIGDASSAYQPVDGMQRFERHILYVRPSTFVIFDDLAAQAPATFSFMLQNESNVWTWDASRVLISQSGTQMAMRVLEPQPWTASSTFEYYYSDDWGGWGLRVNNAVPDTSVKFLMVLNPTVGGEPIVNLLASTATLTAVEITDATGVETQALFRRNASDSVAVDSISTDAQLAVIRRVGGEFTWCSVRDARFLRRGTDYPLRFWSPAATEFEWEYRGDSLVTRGTVHEGIRIWAPTATEVVHEGGSVPFTRDGEFIVIHAGERVPLPISDLTAIAMNGDSILLRWTRISLDSYGDPMAIAGYEVFRIYPDGAYEYLGSVPGTDSTFVDQSLLSGQIMLYDVRAVSGEGGELMTSPKARRTPAAKHSKVMQDSK